MSDEGADISKQRALVAAKETVKQVCEVLEGVDEVHEGFWDCGLFC